MNELSNILFLKHLERINLKFSEYITVHNWFKIQRCYK